MKLNWPAQTQSSPVLTFLLAVVLAATLAACSGGGGGDGDGNGNGGGNGGGGGGGTPTPPPVSMCDTEASLALSACLADVQVAQRQCYLNSGERCGQNDSAINNALNTLSSDLSSSCDNAALTAAGFALDLNQLDLELKEQCSEGASALSSRIFGGPHGAVLASNPGAQACLTSTLNEAADFSANALEIYQQCIDGGNCSSAAGQVNTALNASANVIQQSCSNLASLIGISPARLLERTLVDAQCQAAASHGDTANAGLSCGPNTTVPASQAYEFNGSGNSITLFNDATTNSTPSNTRTHTVEREQYVEIELDAASTGARCGNGSNYRFWVQLAPAGFDLNNVIVYQQGGGSCIGAQCDQHIQGALDHAQGNNSNSLRLTNIRAFNLGSDGGRDLTSFNTNSNPYRNWTKVYLQYCTQDLHLGGQGAQENYTVNSQNFTVHRTGAHNVREALRVARNVVWGALQDEGMAYLPSEFNVMYSGASAGGFGVAQTHHIPMDELGWKNTAVANLWGQAVDDQAGFGSGLRAQVAGVANAWRLQESVTPYCQETECIHAEENTARALDRMDSSRYPRQHYFQVSAQVDGTQANTTGYGSSAAGRTSWGNVLKDTYCRMRDGANIPEQAQLHFYLPRTFAHTIDSTTPFAPSNQSYMQWLGDWEADFAVSDSVSTSAAPISDGSNSLSVDSFTCP